MEWLAAVVSDRDGIFSQYLPASRISCTFDHAYRNAEQTNISSGHGVHVP